MQEDEPHLLIEAAYSQALDPNSYSNQRVQRHGHEVQIRDFGGTGPLMLLWHGAGCDLTSWETLVPELALQICREIRAIEVASDLAALSCPAMLMLCAVAANPLEEPMVSARRGIAEHIAARHSGIRIEWVQTGHDTIVFNRPDEIAASLRDFLRSGHAQRNANNIAIESRESEST